MSLADTIKVLKSGHAEAFEMGSNLEGISTGCLAVDLVTGIGGFPRRRLTEVFGWESSGKTTLCLAACAKAQRKGLYAAYIDVEHGLDLAHATRMGFNFSNHKKGLYVAPGTFEETMTFVTELAESNECDLIIVDSVPGMVPESELKGEITDVVQIGHRARLLAMVLPKLTKVIDKSNTALVLVNQMRYRIVTGFGAQFDHKPREQASGGAALRFYSSLRINMVMKKEGILNKPAVNLLTGKAETVPTGNLHEATAFKNKVAAPYRKVPFYLRYDPDGEYGIDNLATVIMIAKEKGLITVKGGGHVSYKGAKHNFSVQGDEAIRDLLLEQPEIAAEIRQTLQLPAEG